MLCRVGWKQFQTKIYLQIHPLPVKIWCDFYGKISLRKASWFLLVCCLQDSPKKFFVPSFAWYIYLRIMIVMIASPRKERKKNDKNCNFLYYFPVCWAEIMCFDVFCHCNIGVIYQWRIYVKRFTENANTRNLFLEKSYSTHYAQNGPINHMIRQYIANSLALLIPKSCFKYELRTI